MGRKADDVETYQASDSLGFAEPESGFLDFSPLFDESFAVESGLSFGVPARL